MRTPPVLGEEVRVRAPPRLLAAVDQAANRDDRSLGQPVDPDVIGRA
jgi:hypothetical protein